jgi:RNA polymerase sigma-70 factor (ECF subfamily)
MTSFLAPVADSTPLPVGKSIVPSISDADLAARLMAGEPWAREAFYRRYVKAVWCTALRLVGNSSDADDVVQDTFVEALRDVDKLRNPSRMRAWLLQITVHQAHRRFRRRKLMRKLGLERSTEDGLLETLVKPGAPTEARAELACIDRVLTQVSAHQRFAWMLRHVEGLSLEEVAEACDCSLATAKRRIAHTVKHLETELGTGGTAA